MDWWGGAPQHYRFSYEIVPAGTDVVPPEVRIKGYRPQWRNQPLTAEVQADDGIGGSGVARIETSRDDGLTWTEGASVVVDAPADHSNDGHHFIRFRAVDAAGNVSPYERARRAHRHPGPLHAGVGPGAARCAGARARPSGSASRISRSGCAAAGSWSARPRRAGSSATGVLGSRLTADTIWWDPEYRHRTSVACSWPAGAYIVKIAGTTSDPAGNRWETATCERLLVVK